MPHFSPSNVRQQKKNRWRIVVNQSGIIVFKLLFMLAIMASLLWLYGKYRSNSGMGMKFNKMPLFEKKQSVTGSGAVFTEHPITDQGRKYYPEYGGDR